MRARKVRLTAEREVELEDGLDLFSDRLPGAGEAPRGDAGEHLLEHHPSERIAVGEVAVGGEADLLGAVGASDPGAFDCHPAAAERHLALIVAVAHGASLGIVTALRADNLIDLGLHQLAQHAEADPDAERQQPLLRLPSKLSQRLSNLLWQVLEALFLGRDRGLRYGVHWRFLLSS